MTDDAALPFDERLTELLVAHDEALKAGAPPRPADTPPELRPRLEGGLACMQLLRRLLTPRGETAAPADLPFTQLGRFAVRQELGRGTFGVVFRAFDPQLGRDVALKVPRGEALLTAELRQRFVREARAAAGLEHPNVVPVYEAGQVGSICYIASAYCPGPTLAAWLKERREPVPVAAAAQLVATLAAAVQHAHDRGVIHRDLKPANILLPKSEMQNPKSETGGRPGVSDFGFRISDFTPKVTDFGLAKLAIDGPGDGAGASLTQHGAALGTPSYMAPEQASGHSREVGPAADVYALGAVLYEVLVGRPPFQGETPEDTRDQVRTLEPVPPRRLRPKLPRDLETVCLKCLQKEPPRRYASAAALADDQQLLQRQGHDVPVRIKRAIAHIGLAWVRHDGGTPAEALAEFQQALALLDESVRDRPADMAVRQLQLAACFYLGNCHADLGQYEAAFPCYERVLDNATRLAADHPADPQWPTFCSWSRRQIGMIHYQTGRAGEALAAFQEAVAVCERFAQEHPRAAEWCDTELALLQYNLSLLHHQHGPPERASAAYQRARGLFEKLVEAHPLDPKCHRDLAVVYFGLGVWLTENGQADQAVSWCRKARDLLEKVVRASPADAEARVYLAQSYIDLGEALRLRHGPGPRWGLGARPLGQLWDHAAALVFTEKARAHLEDLIRTYSDNYFTGTFAPRSDLAICYHNRGEILAQFGCRQAARAAFQEAARHQRAVRQRWPKVVRYRLLLGEHYRALADLYRDLGQPNEAAALDRERRQLGPGNPIGS